jgi:hypothetical protein
MVRFVKLRILTYTRDNKKGRMRAGHYRRTPVVGSG